MTQNDYLQLGLFLAIILAATPVIGLYMTRLFSGEIGWLRPVERPLYALAGVSDSRQQHWSAYAIAMLVFNLAGFLLLFVILRLQDMLPLNPQGLPALPSDLAFNTAVSFVTNTNWQAYGGESTMSYFSQMAGLTVQNFVSAATGIAIALVVIRAFARKSVKTIGNFWVDLTRATLGVLLPIAFVAAIFLIWQGMPQNFDAYTTATTLEGAQQVIAQGPVASQVAIKMLGTNGGGFFNANAAHPFENPTALSNFVQMLLIFLIGAALTNVFGRMVKDQRQGYAILATMLLLFVAGVLIAGHVEAGANPLLTQLGVDPAMGNMEGKEVRFGSFTSALFAVITTAASCGAVNAMHSSFLPLGGMIPMLNIMLGEVIVGGVGAGFYGVALFIVATLFIAGLMVGRSPEYLGKKIEAREAKLAVLAILISPMAILVGTAIALVTEPGLAGLLSAGPHGLSEVLYGFTSAAGNNGSAFAGLTANSVFYNTALGITMLLGRFAMIVPVIAMAGGLAAKKATPASAGSFPTHGPMFVLLLAGTILIVGGLTFFPALALGPIVEHLLLAAGTTF
ncbi:potassium-transporting ATPase subunit KdpA [Ferrovibrio terrae]|uniref:Potassium-transporting ATPase potassium-binding subunit n=1 Tax=Ferrovibrio terrae TaxID=2594003 RepID=A0A516GYQ6_9PROT|nr:potassium-transporting ATPase subunit KdpA [Ferrovibrio terrae]QDO96632.1 potassium-transporting ATPase subunit KdpA [Ferrovibrio terrae]